jgi:hypothetical protein
MFGPSRHHTFTGTIADLYSLFRQEWMPFFGVTTKDIPEANKVATNSNPLFRVNCSTEFSKDYVCSAFNCGANSLKSEV